MVCFWPTDAEISAILISKWTLPPEYPFQDTLCFPLHMESRCLNNLFQFGQVPYIQSLTIQLL